MISEKVHKCTKCIIEKRTTKQKQNEVSYTLTAGNVNLGCVSCKICWAHAGYTGTDRSLLIGHNALLLRQIARGLLDALSHRHDDTWHGLWWTSWQHWLEHVENTQIANELSKWMKQSWCKQSTIRSRTHTSFDALTRPLYYVYCEKMSRT